MSLIRSAGARGFRSVVTELGGNANDLARRVDFPVNALDSDDVLVSDRSMAALLELAATELDCPDLGLRVATRQDVGMLGPLAFAVQSSPTLGDALSAAMAYLFVHSEGMQLTTVDDPHGERGVAAMRLDLSVPGYWPVQGTDLTMGFIHRAAIGIAGGIYGLRSVEVPYRPVAPLSVYEEFYGVPVVTDSRAALLRVSAGAAAIPIQTRDDDVRRLAVAMLQHSSRSDRATECAPLVYSTVAQTLGTAAPTIVSIADLMDMHPRTLQRRLADEGTSFSEVLDEVRRHNARRLLSTPQMPLAQVAALLGFTEQASLTRAAHRWWGQSPSAIRRAATIGQNPPPPGPDPS